MPRTWMYRLLTQKKSVFGILLLLLACVLIFEVLYTTNLQKFMPISHGYRMKAPVAGELSENEIMENIELEQPNLPALFLYRNKDFNLWMNSTCAILPTIYELHFINTYWQQLSVVKPRTIVHFHAAYFDNRQANLLGPVVRILSMVQKSIEDIPQLYCQIWYEDYQEPIITQVFTIDFIWMKGWSSPKLEVFQPYLFTCILPQELTAVPQAVSVVEKPCDTATNLLKVTYDVPASSKTKPKKNFVVCVRGISDMRDISLAMIEWFEWLRAVKIDQVFMHKFNVHSNVDKVLEYYKKEGFLTSLEMTLPGEMHNSAYLQHLFVRSKNYNYQFDLIAYNDCLMRNMYQYKYVIPLELNELLMPMRVDSVEEVFESASKNFAAYSVRKASFVEDFNYSDGVKNQDNLEYLKFLKNLHRAKDIAPSGLGIRTFFKTDVMLLIHNHYGLKALTESFAAVDLNPEEIYLEEHIKSCADVNCLRRVFDDRKLHFRNEVVTKIEEVLIHLGLLEYF